MSKVYFDSDKFTRFGQNGQPALEAALQSLAEEILRSVVPNGYCMPQDWDGRIDCLVNLADGSCIGEMLPLVSLTSALIRETGERLNRRIQGQSVELQNELMPPILISSSRT